MGAERLRVAVRLESLVVPAWLHRAVWDVVASEEADLVLAILTTRSRPKRRRLSGAPFRAYEKLDRRFFAFPRDHATPTDIAPLLARCPTFDAEPLSESGELTTSDLAAIRAHRPDLILDFGSTTLRGEILSVAPLGVWTFAHDEQSRRGTPPFVWELMRGSTTSETSLRATTHEGTRLLQRSFAATDPTSLHRSRNGALWKGSRFVARALRDARQPQAVDESLPTPELTLPTRAPNVLELLRFAASVALRVARERLKRRRADCVWFVALRHARGSLLDAPLDGFRAIAQPPDRFYADPFLVADDRKHWLFFEDGDCVTRKGVIRAAEVLEDGRLGDSRVVLERDYHLSYPFVFRHQGVWFMLPETSEHRDVELWRATEFPWRWELDTVLMKDVVAVDPTLLEHAGKLWLFLAMSEAGGPAQDELFLFHADSLAGDWRAHPMNPVVSDARRARPAGRFFAESGRLYRPAQDCSQEYGSAMWIHRVEALDERVYRETPVRRIDASWCPGAQATHTINRAGAFEAIDARIWLQRGEPLEEL